MAPDPQLCEARGAGLNDMFGFHKHGQWSPGRARREKRRGSRSAQGGQGQPSVKAGASGWHVMARGAGGALRGVPDGRLGSPHRESGTRLLERSVALRRWEPPVRVAPQDPYGNPIHSPTHSFVHQMLSSTCYVSLLSTAAPH